jgi:glutamate dehydrogenase
VWRLLHTTFDVIELAERVRVTPLEACTAYWSLFDRLELMWLWDGIGALPRSDRWQTQARGSLRDDLLSALAELTENVLESPEGTVDRWWSANERTVQRAVAQLTEIRRTDSFDITNLSVALRQLRNLALTSVRTG